MLVDACDISPFAVRYACARAAEKQVENVSFFRCDVLDEPLPEGYDVVMCSLFLHHLDDETAVALLSKMGAAAKKLVVVNDLRRSTIGYLLAWFGCRILSRSPVVHVDGPRSVQAAFSLAEMRGVAQRSGLQAALSAKTLAVSDSPAMETGMIAEKSGLEPATREVPPVLFGEDRSAAGSRLRAVCAPRSI